MSDPSFAARLRFPWLFALTAGLFLLDLVVPDPLPFFDETLLVNDLTLDALDPFSKQPDYKKSAVRIRKV